jgi:glutamate synthase domain-containing protein 3
MHPLVHDLDKLKDAELENKINELTKKYFSTHNFDVQQQIIMVLESYKEELSKRQRSAYEKMMNSRNKDLDKLIKVN